MAKGTRYGGASLTEAESADPLSPQPVRVRRAEIGPMKREVKEEESSLGNSSSPSSENEPKSDDETKASPRQPARTTVSHSSQPEKETDDTVRSTGTAGQRAKRTAKAARVSTTDDEFGDDDF